MNRPCCRKCGKPLGRGATKGELCRGKDKNGAKTHCARQFSEWASMKNPSINIKRGSPERAVMLDMWLIETAKS